MNFTQEKEYLDILYQMANLDLSKNEILEIPTFRHDNCDITVTYLPRNISIDIKSLMLCN